MKSFIIIIIIILITYYYMKQNNDVYNRAYRLGVKYLDNINLQPNYAVMFVIDDTFLDSRHKPIKPIIKLMEYCNKNDILVLIITARDSIYTEDTVQELVFNGIYSKHDNFYNTPKNAIFYDFLYLRKDPEDNHNMFKSNVKEHLARKNGIITIMSIGDNEVDIVGGYSGYSIKLPNTRDPRLFHSDNGHIVEVR